MFKNSLLSIVNMLYLKVTYLVIIIKTLLILVINTLSKVIYFETLSICLFIIIFIILLDNKYLNKERKVSFLFFSFFFYKN